MKHFYTYVDEAGDEGFGKLRNPETRHGQSTWLILGSLIVGAAGDKKLPGWKAELRDKFPSKKQLDLHWGNLNHDQRIVVCKRLAELPIGLALTASHKVTIPGSSFENTFKKPQYLYNYLVRFLMERLITACEERADEEGARLHVIFSRRGGTDYESMKTYLRFLAAGKDKVKSPRKTNWSVLDIEGIEVVNHSKRAGLQLADCVTSAFFNALEPNKYGNMEPSYALRLAERLIEVGGQVKGEGLTVVPGLHAAKCDDEQKAFLKKCWRLG